MANIKICKKNKSRSDDRGNKGPTGIITGLSCFIFAEEHPQSESGDEGNGPSHDFNDGNESLCRFWKRFRNITLIKLRHKVIQAEGSDSIIGCNIDKGHHSTYQSHH